MRSKCHPQLNPRLSTRRRHGTIIGHIAAKGLHTNLLLQVAVSEDCRFAFAGVLRGSAQMLAWDLSYLPTWSTYDRKAKLSVEAFLRMHAHSDAKLKGFGACTRLLPHPATVAASSSPMGVKTPAKAAGAATAAGPVAEYLLICGRGIKNIHVWSFKVPLDPAGDGVSHAGFVEPAWELVHDISTNGMTIELIGFRAGGAVAFSRSKGYGLRLWDLENAATTQQQKDAASRTSSSSMALLGADEGKSQPPPAAATGGRLPT